MTDAKGQGKSVEELFPCPFFTGAETGQCKSNGSLYAARHLWEEAAKRLKGQIKGQTEKKKSETLRFQTSQWQREKDSNSDSGVFITFSHTTMCKTVRNVKQSVPVSPVVL